MRERDPWALYDALISKIPKDIVVLDWTIGTNWTYVEAECGMGMAMTVSGGPFCIRAKSPEHPSLREMAALSKSWNMQDASLGVAALNAWYSRREMLAGMDVVFEDDKSDERAAGMQDPLIGLRPQMQGKKACVIGHFPHVYDLGEGCEEFTVLERKPSDRDLPDPASEFVLPMQDFVISTGTTITNKTIVRILELCQKPLLALTGPSVVPAPVFFDFGADILAGRVIDDPEKARFVVKNGHGMPFGRAIKRMAVYRKA